MFKLAAPVARELASARPSARLAVERVENVMEAVIATAVDRPRQWCTKVFQSRLSKETDYLSTTKIRIPNASRVIAFSNVAKL